MPCDFRFAPPQINRNRRGQSSEEISIPHRLSSYKIDCAPLSGILRPDQNTASAISEKIAIAHSGALAYRPYIYLDSVRKRGLPIIENQRAIGDWENDAGHYSSHQPASIQQYNLFRLRLILAADLARAFDSFGGSIAHFNNLGLLVRNSIIESPAQAISYDQHLRNKVSSLARESAPGIDYFSLLIAEQFELRRYVSGSPLSGKRRKERNAKILPLNILHGGRK